MVECYENLHRGDWNYYYRYYGHDINERHFFDICGNFATKFGDIPFILRQEFFNEFLFRLSYNDVISAANPKSNHRTDIVRSIIPRER